MFTAETKVRVRYGETDKMGYAYYGYYTLYYEVARTDAMRTLGMTYKELEAMGIMLPVSEVNIKYIKPAFYDDELLIKTFIKKLPGLRIVFDYEIYNPDNELINTGQSTLVFINQKENKPCKPPDKFIKKIKTYF